LRRQVFDTASSVSGFPWSTSSEVIMVEPESLVVTVEQAAELLGISRGLAYELVRRGEIPSIRLGRRLVVTRRRLLAMIDGPSPVGAW
jgi:excisionase family DNA binding protein